MRVVLGDVDAAGVLYFAVVYRWHERVFSEWLVEIGCPLESLLGTGRGLPVRTSWADYPASAALGGELSVAHRIEERTDTEFVFRTEWTDARDRQVAVVRTRHVACVRGGGTTRFRRCRIWPELAQHLGSGQT